MTISNNNQDVSVDGPKWYIVHTYSGQEDIVERNLKLRIQSLGMHEKIMDVVVPTEEEVVFKDGQRTPERKKLFPGYILVQMTMDDDSWYIVRNTPGVTGFISTEDDYDKRPRPVPLEDNQAEEILNKAGELQKANKTSKHSDSFYQKLNKILFSKEWKIAPGYIISLGIALILTFIILRNVQSVFISMSGWLGLALVVFGYSIIFVKPAKTKKTWRGREIDYEKNNWIVNLLKKFKN